MAQNSEDLRVRRTRKLLQNALLELTPEKGFSNVTVSVLAERAMINRSTFYRHYQDKYDLLRQYLEELSARLESQGDDASGAEKPERAPDTPPADLVSLLEHMQMNADFYRAMLGEKGDPAFCAQSFGPFIEKQIRNRLPGEIESEDGGSLPIGLASATCYTPVWARLCGGWKRASRGRPSSLPPGCSSSAWRASALLWNRTGRKWTKLFALL